MRLKQKNLEFLSNEGEKAGVETEVNGMSWAKAPGGREGAEQRGRSRE